MQWWFVLLHKTACCTILASLKNLILLHIYLKIYFPRLKLENTWLLEIQNTRHIANWDLKNESATREDVPLPTVSNIQETYQSNDGHLTEDEDDTDFYAVLLLPVRTTSQTISQLTYPWLVQLRN